MQFTLITPDDTAPLCEQQKQKIRRHLQTLSEVVARNCNFVGTPSFHVDAKPKNSYALGGIGVLSVIGVTSDQIESTKVLARAVADTIAGRFKFPADRLIIHVE